MSPPTPPMLLGTLLKARDPACGVAERTEVDQVERGMVEPNIVKATSSPGADGSGMDHLSVG